MTPGIPFPDFFSPEIFSVSIGGFPLALRWYAMAYIVGLLLGWRLVSAALRQPALWRNGSAPMRPEQVDDLLTWIILGVILGGRLGYVAFYQPAYYLAHPVEILAVWQGGMAFHGGFLGVVCATWIWCRKNAVPLANTADLMALAAPLGLFLGRLANFINAELWGRATDLPWGVIFPGHAAQACGQPIGQLCARHPSQLYEAATEGLLLGIVLLWLVWRKRALWQPWLVSGVFFLGYGASRFLVEFARQPDAQFVTPDNPVGLVVHWSGWGLTMGQLLTLPMIAVGLWLILRRSAP